MPTSVGCARRPAKSLTGEDARVGRAAGEAGDEGGVVEGWREMDLDRVPSAWRLLVPAGDDGDGDL
jgi:hypothetical protein